jgi:elongation factor G
MEAMLEENVTTPELLHSAIRKATVANELVPVFCGSAYKNKGVQLLLDGVLGYLPAPYEVENIGSPSPTTPRCVVRSDPKLPFAGWRSSSKKAATASSPTCASTRAR